MNPDHWLSVFQSISIGAGLLAAAALIGTVVVGKKIGVRQAEKMLTLETGLAGAKKEQAQAELQLRALTNQQLMASLPRSLKLLSEPSTIKLLKESKKGTAEILYIDEDQEAFMFADVLAGTLESAGWKVTKVKSISANDPSHILPGFSLPELRSAKLPLLMRAGGTSGLTLITNGQDKAILFEEGTARHALRKGLMDSHFIVSGMSDPRLPDDVVRVVIGKKD